MVVQMCPVSRSPVVSGLGQNCELELCKTSLCLFAVLKVKIDAFSNRIFTKTPRKSTQNLRLYKIELLQFCFSLNVQISLQNLD